MSSKKSEMSENIAHLDNIKNYIYITPFFVFFSLWDKTSYEVSAFYCCGFIAMYVDIYLVATNASTHIIFSMSSKQNLECVLLIQSGHTLLTANVHLLSAGTVQTRAVRPWLGLLWLDSGQPGSPGRRAETNCCSERRSVGLPVTSPAYSLYIYHCTTSRCFIIFSLMPSLKFRCFRF